MSVLFPATSSFFSSLLQTATLAAALTFGGCSGRRRVPSPGSTDVQDRYALILNGDTEPRHLENVDTAIRALRKEGTYRIFAASPEPPRGKVERFAKIDHQSIDPLIDGLRSSLGPRDLLVVYLTGHGGEGETGEGCLDIPGSCYPIKDIQKKLLGLNPGKRVVVMDMCYAGAGLAYFADGKTTVATAGSPGQQVNCQDFSPYFWSDDVTDRDKDGVITVQERFAFVQTRPVAQIATPQFFYPAQTLSFSGKSAEKPPFEAKVTVVHDGESLKEQFRKLQPGQLALVTFSADWCGPCKEYKPVFEALAKKYKGQYLMILAEGVKGSEKDWKPYGIPGYPTVAFVDWRAGVYFVLNPEDPVATLIPKEGEGQPIQPDEKRAWAQSEEGSKALPEIIKKLDSHDPNVRYEALYDLMWFGEKAASAVPALIKRLEDEIPDIRREAIGLLYQIGPEASSAFPALKKKLKDEDALTRLYSAGALFDLARDTEETLPVFIATLGEKEPELQYTAMEHLKNFGDDAAPAIPALITTLRDQEPNIRSQAAFTLASIGPKALLATSALKDMLQDTDQVARIAAGSALHSIVGDRETFLSTLMEGLQDRNPHVRFLALNHLRSLGGDSVAALPALIKSLEDESSDIKIAAIEVLENIGQEAAPALPALMKALKDSDALIQVQAARAVWRIALDPDSTFPILAKALDHSDSKVRARAAETIGEFGDKLISILPILIQKLDDSDSWVRFHAITAIGRLQERASPAIPAMMKRLEDEREDLRGHAMGFFNMLGILSERTPALRDQLKPVIPALKRKLKDGEIAIRFSAAIALWSIAQDTASTIPVLLEALDQPDPMRWDAISTLGNMGKKASQAVPALKRLLKKAVENRDSLVQEMIQKALRNITGKEK